MKILDKLQKLIAHQESARAIGNVAEAEAFAERIQQLLDKHNLTMSDVELRARKNSPVDFDLVQSAPIKIEKWHKALLFNLARLNGCHGLEHPSGVQFVVGRTQDRQIVISLFHYFEKLGNDLADRFMTDEHAAILAVYTNGGYRPRSSSGYSIRRNSFLLGFVARVAERLEKSHAAAQKPANSAALVFLGNREKDNQKFIDETFNIERQESLKEENLDRPAFQRGASAGDSVALTDKILK